jgi:glutamine amidotransferase
MITVIDYGMGNLGSIVNIIRKVGGDAVIASDPDEILLAKKIILPGVGSFDAGMKNLREKNLITPLNKKIMEEKTPLLGICLGMQLITKKSEEGALLGLGWIDAETVKFKFSTNDLKIPHMGWNYLSIKKPSKLFTNMYEEPRFYFVHSYYVACNDKKDILTTTDYGFEFASAIEKENIYATQFHPEKSHKYGIKLIQNFIELV